MPGWVLLADKRWRSGRAGWLLKWFSYLLVVTAKLVFCDRYPEINTVQNRANGKKPH